MKAKAVGYWICTALITFAFLPGGIFYLMRAPQAVEGVMRLGFPFYFVIFLGVWKVLGVIAILVPRFPLLKEWAYAGMFFDLSGAVVAVLATGGVWWHVAAPLGVMALLAGSWALRPPSRKLVS